MHKRKAQIALEFLTTYAWAFLVVLVMIGALAYFGILNPSSILPDRCTFGVSLNCLDHAVDYVTGDDGTVTLRMKNGVGEAITITDVQVFSESVNLTCTTPTAPTPISMSSNEVANFALTDCEFLSNGYFENDRVRLNFFIKFYETRSGSAFTKQVEGEVYSTLIVST